MTTEFARLHPRLAEVFGIDLRTLALFRFALGLTLFCVVCRCIPDAAAFWSDAGALTRAQVFDYDGLHRLSLYFLNGTPWFATVLMLVQAVFALMFMLGWRTRLASILSFVLWASLVNRGVLTLIGGDLLMSCLLFWAMFLPTGARFSVDAALASEPPPKDNRHLSWASAALLVQVMSVYFFSALLKSSPQWVPDYTAVYYALSLDRYATPLGLWLLDFPLLLKALTFFVWWLELLGPLLIFSPVLTRVFRLPIQLAFMAMHVGFLLCLELGHFPFVSLSSLTVFTGGWIWDALKARDERRNAGKLRIYYDRDCGFCLKMCLLFQQFLVLPRAQIAPAQDTPRAKTLLEANYSWVVIDTDDQAHLKWPAFVTLLRRSPLLGWLWPLARHPRLVGPGNRVYDFVGRHRGAFGGLTGRFMPMRAEPWEVGPGWQNLAGVLMAACLAWNLASLAPVMPRWTGMSPGAMQPFADRVYAWLGAPMRLLRIDQYWNMFAPHPLINDGWMVIPARLADGSEIDLLHPERAPDYAKPHHYSQTHRNIRWHTYLGRLSDREFSAHLLNYGRYLCRTWNAEHFDDPELRKQRLMTFKIIYVTEPTPPPGGTAVTEQSVLWRHECFPDETRGVIP